MSEDLHVWKPDWAVHPGQLLDEYVETTGAKLSALSEIVGVSEDELERIISKTSPVTEEIASGLEKAFGLKSYIWVNIQKNWDEHQANTLSEG